MNVLQLLVASVCKKDADPVATSTIDTTYLNTLMKLRASNLLLEEDTQE